jgi:hippurate hydrolase
MNAASANPTNSLLSNLPGLLPNLEALYKDIHAHPELSMQENRTADLAAKHLRSNGYEVTTGVGKTGVVGLLKNGDGPTVMLRADMDALPIKEISGVDYASSVTATDAEGNTTPVAHACGHDMHVAWLTGVAALFAQQRGSWRGDVNGGFPTRRRDGAGCAGNDQGRLIRTLPEARSRARSTRHGRTGRRRCRERRTDYIRRR